ncbi:MAG: hypothetical protein IPM14_15895 [bacterium]|nr:hypothetical protein [bacterium]
MASSETEFKLIDYKDVFLNQKSKKITAKGFGEKTASLNAFFLDYLKGYNIPSAYQKRTDKYNLQFIKVTELPFRVKILNNADKRISKLFSVKNLSQLELPVQELHYGDSKDTIVTESHLISFNLSTYDDIKFIYRLCSKINAIVKSFFERRNVSLVELTCIFGKFEGKIFLIGDFSPMSMKIIDNTEIDTLPNPYKIETFAQMKKYTDILVKLTSGE